MVGLGSIDSHFFDRQHIASATAKRTACAVLWSDVPPNTQPPKAELSCAPSTNNRLEVEALIQPDGGEGRLHEELQPRPWHRCLDSGIEIATRRSWFGFCR